MNDLLAKHPPSKYLRAIGMDEVSIKKGHSYGIVVADLDQQRPMLLKANRRLNKAYILKESFGQLWDYNNPTWARKFFDNWKGQLRWSRLQPFQKFVELVERHWEGIISYCHPDHKVSLGFMEGLNNKIRVIQRRSFGIKDLQ